jgi:hypothetical protein
MMEWSRAGATLVFLSVFVSVFGRIMQQTAEHELVFGIDKIGRRIGLG